MTAPRLEVDLCKIRHNAQTLVERLGGRQIEVMGVTKACLGAPALARELLQAGVNGLGESRIENIETMRRAGVEARMSLIRGPMLSQAERVVAHADVSFNTEIAVIEKLSAAARASDYTHGVVLMVELGDLREGIMPQDLEDAVRATLRLPNITLEGIGANLACRNGVIPDDHNMGEPSALATATERTFGLQLGTVSAGNSANIEWALGTGDTGRVNELRLGEALLLGCEPLRRSPLEGLWTDAFTLTAEVIEAKCKPSQPWGERGQSAFGAMASKLEQGSVVQTLLALGHQDTDPLGLLPPPGVTVEGASGDHLIVSSTASKLAVGDEVSFHVDYRALLRSMTSPFVVKQIVHGPKV